MSKAVDTSWSRRGMSLLELLVVLAILSVVGGLAVGSLLPSCPRPGSTPGCEKL